MRKFTWLDRLRYEFDNTMARGTIALIGWLFLLSIALIVVVSLVAVATNAVPSDHDGPPNFYEIVWMSLLRTLDPGTMGGDQGSPLFLGLMLFITMGGIFIVSTLIGLLSTGIESKIEELRKGRSVVIERNHVVILGWSPQIFTILNELMLANENQRNVCIAILAPHDKVEMEDQIRDRVKQIGRTRIVCRTGNPFETGDLEIINPASARSIIILSPENDDPDAFVLKTTLALLNQPGEQNRPYHIVAELRNQKNLEIGRMIARGQAQFILVNDLIARMTVQTCRHAGLSVVYTELLGFDGDEIYFAAEPTLIGKTFGDALLAYEDSAVMGLFTADQQVRLLPPMDYTLVPGDQLIVIAADDDTIKRSGITDLKIDTAAITNGAEQTVRPEQTLILGWNGQGPLVVTELDNYAAAGSQLQIVADVAGAELLFEDLRERLQNLALHFQHGDITDRTTLEALKLERFDHIIVLSYSDTLTIQEADAKTLVALLHLRNLAELHGYRFSVVSEMLDIRNRDLATIARVDDFIVSDRLGSLLLAQIAENRFLIDVFTDLFDASGSEIYIKPVERYVSTDRPLNFYTIVEAAKRHGQIAIGYRLRAANGADSGAYGIRVNPPKSESITFRPGDQIVVISED